jgi:hypothetical protein
MVGVSISRVDNLSDQHLRTEILMIGIGTANRGNGYMNMSMCVANHRTLANHVGLLHAHRDPFETSSTLRETRRQTTDGFFCMLPVNDAF